PPPGRRPSRRPNEILATSGCLFEWRGIARPDAVDRWHIVDEFDDGGGLATHVATVEDGIELVIEALFDLPASGEALRLIGKGQCGVEAGLAQCCEERPYEGVIGDPPPHGLLLRV